MKKLTLTLTMLASSAVAFAQQEPASQTLIKNQVRVSGWFVELPFTHAEINKEHLFMTGLSGGIIINEKLRLGLAGRGYNSPFNRVELDQADEGKGGFLQGRELGLHVEPVIESNKLMHFTFPVIIGAGQSEITTKEKYLNSDNEMKRKQLDHHDYFMIKPSAQVEFNLHKNFRVGAGVGYRFTSNSKMAGLSDDALRGISTNISVKIGKF